MVTNNRKAGFESSYLLETTSAGPPVAARPLQSPSGPDPTRSITTKTAEKLDYLDKRLFDLPLLARLLGLKSHEQTAWINMVARQAKTEAATIYPTDPTRHS